MKCGKVFLALVLGLILTLLVAVLPTIPAHALGEELGFIYVDPEEGEIGDWVELSGYYFDADFKLYIYFSSDEAEIGDEIDEDVTAYKITNTVYTDADGDFSTLYNFEVPDELTDGEDREYVHGGDYYLYAVYYGHTEIVAVARFAVTMGEIEIDPEEGTVGTEVAIGGKGLRNNQKITIQYDGGEIDIAGGDKETTGEGQLACTIVIPESTADSHTITVIEESGNELEAEFSVRPEIAISPTSQSPDKAVKISGTGFGGGENILITFNDEKVSTTPIYIHTDKKGNFDGSFIMPFYPSYAGGSTAEIEACDESFNIAEAQLTVLAMPASLSLHPVTSPISPGHAGMELAVEGSWFEPGATVTVTFSDGGEITVATVEANSQGNFLATFAVPPGRAGSHTITATDGIKSLTAVFTMESAAPPMPRSLKPEMAATTGMEVYFDWEDVADNSGVTYVLQIGADIDFATVVLEKEGLTESEYTVRSEEELEPTGKSPYYWRVKAVDNAFNQGEWTAPILFYVGPSKAALPGWMMYIWIGLGVVLLAIVGFLVRKRFAR